MRILIIGGTNFIGPYVVGQLTSMGYEVTVFHRGRTETNLPEGVGHIFGDRQNLMNFADEIEQFSPDVVLDMIPMNQRDAKTLVDVFGGIVQRVVAISSQDVYRAYDIVRGLHPSLLDPVPLAEDAPLRENLYPYAGEGVKEYEKILVEEVVMGAPELSGTILRLPTVYGPGDYQRRLFPYLRRMDDERPAILLEESMAPWRWTHGFVENIAAAITLAVTDERAVGRIYNIGEPEPLPWVEWVRQIGYVAGWSGEIVEVPEDIFPAHLRLSGNPDFSQHWVVGTDRIRRELGYEEIVSTEEALRRTVAWERQHPPEEINLKNFDYAAEDAALNVL